MNRKELEKKYLKNCNVSEVLSNKEKRSAYTFRVSPIASGYLVNGKLISEKEFDAMFPITLKPARTKGANFDKTKNWLFGERSY